MCLLLASVTGLDTIKMEPWLSLHTGIGWRLYPSSPSSCDNHFACLPQSDRETYSASVEEWAIHSCLQERQLKVQLASLKNQPVCEWWSLWLSTQSESVSGGLPEKHHQIQGSSDESQVDIGRCKVPYQGAPSKDWQHAERGLRRHREHLDQCQAWCRAVIQSLVLECDT